MNQRPSPERKARLELTWVGKENRPRVEPRILLEDETLGCHGIARANAIFDNRLIFGDNLLALKALEQEFSGRVKCCLIDPPYNTGSAFAHYEDGLEHSLWLSLMRDRLDLIRRLLSEDGSLWITIDDNEAHYLKVLCDEVFGRANFVANVVWQKRTSPERSAEKGSLFNDRRDASFAKTSRSSCAVPSGSRAAAGATSKAFSTGSMPRAASGSARRGSRGRA